MSSKKVAVFLADGFEEIEAMTPIDFLCRAGVDVIVAGVGTDRPKGAHGVTVQTDITAAGMKGSIDGVVLPGGMPGSVNLAESEAVREITCRTMENGGMVASLCAAPAVALGSFGILEGRRFTCYPGFEEKVIGAEFSPDRVVKDGNLITSRGPGTAAEFAIELVRYLVGDETADSIVEGTLLAGQA